MNFSFLGKFGAFSLEVDTQVSQGDKVYCDPHRSNSFQNSQLLCVCVSISYSSTAANISPFLMSQITYINEEKTKGEYTYPDGNVYVGDFKNEKFHGEGTLIFKDKGTYKGTWENGKIVRGNYYFSDGLQYEDRWKYLADIPYFYNEKINTNEVIYKEEKRNAYLDDIYDIGTELTAHIAVITDRGIYVVYLCDGYCKIDEGTVYDFRDNKKIRKVNERENNWIKNHCAKY
ncbi:MORN repeat protein, putative [Plasmodium ovale curtisi]|uniref:MORN repeat-containing protein 5 n=1 Tax=Plasmodium ovale curtisi TaxID=864141 RepID=A0A1A8X1J5_PLAOA|nr:MORN repeat protein, putative [Plasmodium ovale curtisi]SBS97560.1 MORN repeat protein, putative [Plasmodium ovale curtisi]